MVIQSSNKNTIVVSDESGSIGLAGIMGGNSTSVSDKTTSVFEAAFPNFKIYGRKSERIWYAN